MSELLGGFFYVRYWSAASWTSAGECERKLKRRILWLDTSTLIPLTSFVCLLHHPLCFSLLRADLQLCIPGPFNLGIAAALGPITGSSNSGRPN